MSHHRRPRSIGFLLAVAAVCVAFFPAFTDVAWAQRRSSGGTVRVRGYVRKDGTYVAPHYRSAPDGNFYNNWSTQGNVNPFTGEEGTKTEPPSRSSRSTGSSFAPLSGIGSGRWDEGKTTLPPPSPRPITRTPRYSPGSPTVYVAPRSSKITAPPTARLRTLVPIKPASTHDWMAEQDKQARIRMASELRGLGDNVDWNQHSYFEMSDRAARIRIARELKGLGLQVAWGDHSYFEMSDWASRIRMSRELKGLGVTLDWKEHSYFAMSDMASRIRISRELSNYGIKVDWKQHSYFGMSDRLWKARQKDRVQP